MKILFETDFYLLNSATVFWQQTAEVTVGDFGGDGFFREMQIFIFEIFSEIFTQIIISWVDICLFYNPKFLR